MIRTEVDARNAKANPNSARTDLRVAGATSLQLRVSPTGSKVWRLRSRKTGVVMLGHWPDVSLAEAKRAAVLLVAQAERQAVNDKTGAKVLAVKETRTLGDVLDAYAKARGAGLASWPDTRAMIALRYNPKHKIKSFTEAKMLTPVEAQRTVAAKRSCRYLSTVLRWAKAGTPIDNAVLDYLVPEKARERVLTDAEVWAVWRASGQLEAAWRDFVRVLMLTMARRKDAAEAVAGDFRDDVWHRRIHKSGGAIEPHPLAPMAASIIGKRLSGGPVFATRQGNPLRNNFDRSLKRLHHLSGTGGWTYHDLRRTSRTLMGRAGVPREVSERCMSHSQGKIERTYDRFDYGPQMLEAYTKLEAMLLP